MEIITEAFRLQSLSALQQILLPLQATNFLCTRINVVLKLEEMSLSRKYSKLAFFMQHIEDSFKMRKVTGAVFVNLSAACNAVNHHILITKVYQMTDDKAMTILLGTLLKNRIFYVVLNQKKSWWWQQQNGLPEGSVLAPLLYNIYTNDQPTDKRTSRFIYADNLCIASQESSFEAVKQNLTDSLTLLAECSKD